MNQLNYYKNNKELGLDNEYRRVKSLNKCFHSKWWKHTEKNNIEWNKIHKILRSKIIVLYPTTTEYYLNDKQHLIVRKLFFRIFEIAANKNY